MSDKFNVEVKPEAMEESMADAPVEPAKKADKKQKKQKKADDFISRKLKVINTMHNPAKKMRLAERVLNNRKAGK